MHAESAADQGPGAVEGSVPVQQLVTLINNYIINYM